MPVIERFMLLHHGMQRMNFNWQIIRCLAFLNQGNNMLRAFED